MSDPRGIEERLDWFLTHNPSGPGMCAQQHGRMSGMDLLSRIAVDPVTDCHNWMGARSLGYGIIEAPGYRARGDRRVLMAHRVMYEMAHGFTDAEHVHHRCENKKCVNPEHLQPLTQQENNRLAYSTYRDGTCERGHSDIRTTKTGRHYCRTCNADRMRLVRAQNRGDQND